MTLAAVHAAAAQSATWPEPADPSDRAVPGRLSSDIVARIVAQKLGERLGQQLVVENRPGASGNLGTEAVAHAAADGYTLGLANTSTHTLSPSLMAKPTYDPVKDFVPISMIGASPFVLALLSRRARKERAGADRALQDEAAHLRLGRPGDAGQSRRRPVRQDRAYRADAGVLSRQRPGDSRRRRRPRRHGVRDHSADIAVDPRRQSARHCGHRAATQPGACGCANRRGIRAARLRERAVAGALCAGRHAGSRS